MNTQRVILTHSPNRFPGLQEQLRPQLQVLHWPLIHTESLPTSPALQQQLKTLGHHWWVITSQATVEALQVQGFDWHKPKFAVVGAQTARAVEKLTGRVCLVAHNSNALSLAKDLLGHDSNLREVVFPHGDLVHPDLPNALEQAGVDLHRICLYRTLPKPWSNEQILSTRGSDLIVLFSPSAVDALPAAVAQQSTLLAFGSSTAARIEARGWACSVGHDMRVMAVAQTILHACQNPQSVSPTQATKEHNEK